MQDIRELVNEPRPDRSREPDDDFADPGRARRPVEGEAIQAPADAEPPHAGPEPEPGLPENEAPLRRGA